MKKGEAPGHHPGRCVCTFNDEKPIFIVNNAYAPEPYNLFGGVV